MNAAADEVPEYVPPASGGSEQPDMSSKHRGRPTVAVELMPAASSGEVELTLLPDESAGGVNAAADEVLEYVPPGSGGSEHLETPLLLPAVAHGNIEFTSLPLESPAASVVSEVPGMDEFGSTAVHNVVASMRMGMLSDAKRLQQLYAAVAEAHKLVGSVAQMAGGASSQGMEASTLDELVEQLEGLDDDCEDNDFMQRVDEMWQHATETVDAQIEQLNAYTESCHDAVRLMGKQQCERESQLAACSAEAEKLRALQGLSTIDENGEMDLDDLEGRVEELSNALQSAQLMTHDGMMGEVDRMTRMCDAMEQMSGAICGEEQVKLPSSALVTLQAVLSNAQLEHSKVDDLWEETVSLMESSMSELTATVVRISEQSPIAACSSPVKPVSIFRPDISSSDSEDAETDSMADELLRSIQQTAAAGLTGELQRLKQMQQLMSATTQHSASDVTQQLSQLEEMVCKLEAQVGGEQVGESAQGLWEESSRVMDAALATLVAGVIDSSESDGKYAAFMADIQQITAEDSPIVIGSNGGVSSEVESAATAELEEVNGALREELSQLQRELQVLKHAMHNSRESAKSPKGAQGASDVSNNDNGNNKQRPTVAVELMPAVPPASQ